MNFFKRHKDGEEASALTHCKRRRKRIKEMRAGDAEIHLFSGVLEKWKSGGIDQAKIDCDYLKFDQEHYEAEICLRKMDRAEPAHERGSKRKRCIKRREELESRDTYE